MALGRGLSELLGEVESAYENSTDHPKDVTSVDVNLIKANPNQPRKIFDEKKLLELASSIKEYGLLQAITVIRDDENENSYIVVAGERRLRAHKLANIDKIKVSIISLDSMQLREVALIENIQRDDLNIIELSYSYAQLINEHSLTHEELSLKVFKSRTSITNTLRLLQLSAYVQQFLANDKITAGHAKVMLGLSDIDQKKVADSVLGQKLSVRETEKLVKILKQKDEPKKDKKEPKNKKFDFNPLQNVVKNLEGLNLKVKAEKNYFKIEINSQEDIDKISNTFSNTL